MLNTRRCVNKVSRPLLVAFEFYSPIFFRLSVCQCTSALSQFIIGVYSLRVFFSLATLLCNFTSWLELLFLRYTIASPFDISPFVFYETWLRTWKFRKLQKRPGVLKTIFQSPFKINIAQFNHGSCSHVLGNRKSSRVSCSIAEETGET